MSGNTFISNKLLYSVSVGLGVGLLSGLVYYFKYLKNERVPKKWKRVGTLTEINVFPVKSCAPLKLSPDTEIHCDTLGCHLNEIRDRGLMVLNENHEMITARIYPKMVLIKTKITGTKKLYLTNNGLEPLEVNLEEIAKERSNWIIDTAVWGVKVKAILCGEKYNRWFSKVILEKDSGLFLVYFPYTKPAKGINPRMSKEPFITKSDTGTFNDATSFMLINLSSVDDLNTRIENPVDPLQFRGNFCVKTDNNSPYAENNWEWVKIGNEAVFRNISPCTRCIFTNINAFSGNRDPDGNPLNELKKYRKWTNYSSGPVFGIHLGIREQGVVKINDTVYVEDKA